MDVIARDAKCPHMADTHGISAVVDKRARIDGVIKARRYKLMRLEIELVDGRSRHQDVPAQLRPLQDRDQAQLRKEPSGNTKRVGAARRLRC